MIVVDTEFFSSFRQKEHLISQIKRLYKNVRLSYTDNLIIYQYDDGNKNY